MIIDTHAHLYAEEFSEDQTEVFARAAAAGVHYFYSQILIVKVFLLWKN